jgi:hypothetical protein
MSVTARSVAMSACRLVAWRRALCPRLGYDRTRGNLDRHATYIVAAYLAGAAR